MKTIRNLLGVALGLLLCQPASAQSQFPSLHLTAAQVTGVVSNLDQQHREIPTEFLDAYFNGVGLTIYDAGVYMIDGYQNFISPDLQEATYNQVMTVTGDPVLASQAALGLLTDAEIRRARGEDVYGGGSWGTLHNFYGAFGFSYEPQGGGGGGYLN